MEPPPRECSLKEDRAWAETHLAPFASCAVYNWSDTDRRHVANDGTRATAFDWAARTAIEKQHGCKLRQHVYDVEAPRHTLELDVRDEYATAVLRIREDFKRAIDARTVVVDFIVNQSLLRLQHNLHTYAGGKGVRVLPQCESFEDALHRLRRNFALLPEGQARYIYANMRSYYSHAILVRNASRAELARLKQIKEKRIKEKSNGNCWLLHPDVDDDVLAEILQWVQPVYLFKLQYTCRAMATQSTLALRHPHLLVRCLPTSFGTVAEAERHVAQKWFPHYTEKRTGTSESEVHVVCKKRAVVLLVDLAVCGTIRANPVQSRRETAKHANLNANGEPNSWHATDFNERPAARRARRANMEQCRTRKAPEDDHVPEGWFRKRIATHLYFEDQLHVNEVQLLYADTLEPVPVSRGEPPVVVNMLTKKDTRYRMDSTYTADDGIPYPAKLSVTVNALSSLHDNRSFVLRVRAKSRILGRASEEKVLTATTPKFQTTYKLAHAQRQEQGAAV